MSGIGADVEEVFELGDCSFKAGQGSWFLGGVPKQCRWSDLLLWELVINVE